MYVNQTYWSHHFKIQTNIESLYYIPETNTVFHVNNTSIRKKEKKEHQDVCLTALGLFLVLPIFLLLWSALLCLMHCLLPGPFGWTLSLRTCLILILIWFYSWSLQVLFFFVLGLLSIIFFALQHKAQFCFHPEPNSHILPSVSFLSPPFTPQTSFLISCSSDFLWGHID